MNITLVSTYDSGGASKACIRLHSGLIQSQINATLLLKNSSQIYSNTELFKKNETCFLNCYRLVQKKLNLFNKNLYLKNKWEKSIINIRPKGLDYYSLPFSETDITSSSAYNRSDIINLHWVANFLDWNSFFKKNIKPLVWTLHDQNPYLGGEHYKELFNGIDENGFPISRKYSNDENKLEHDIRKFKKNVLKNTHNLHIVCPSKWMLNLSKNSELFYRFKHFHIPYGFPTNIYKKENKNYSKNFWGIPLEKKVILFVADYVNNSRKGFIFLKKAFESLDNVFFEDTLLCVIGNKQSFLGIKNVINLGFITDEKSMALAYSMSDVFVLPSLVDNLPNTMIESILCGTPVIAFNVGGISESIIDGENGYLCPEISVQSLRSTIEKFLVNPNFFNNKYIESTSKSKYDLSMQVKLYAQLYESILGNK